MFHTHRWESVAASLDPINGQFTVILLHCQTCGGFSTKRLDGQWTDAAPNIQNPFRQRDYAALVAKGEDGIFTLA